MNQENNAPFAGTGSLSPSEGALPSPKILQNRRGTSEDVGSARESLSESLPSQGIVNKVNKVNQIFTNYSWE